MDGHGGRSGAGGSFSPPRIAPSPAGDERKKKDRDMSKKLFVGGLSWDTTDARLQAAFAPHGEITEAKVITDRDTGRSRGFGFVTFAAPEDAAKAIAALDGKELDGRAIKVNEAQDKPRDGGGRSGGGGGRNNRW
jgi:RNA recognition motif-containing protein